MKTTITTYQIRLNRARDNSLLTPEWGREGGDSHSVFFLKKLGVIENNFSWWKLNIRIAGTHFIN
jgi:hypothetical protein